MGEIINILSVKENIEKGIIPNDPNQLLKIVASSAKKSKGMKKDDFVNNPELFIRGKISSFLLEKEMINPDLFQCTLYVAKIISSKFNETPESYYAIDYLLKAKAGDSSAFLRGGDCCFLLCTLLSGKREAKNNKFKILSCYGKTNVS